jgi:hypothetical protein
VVLVFSWRAAISTSVSKCQQDVQDWFAVSRILSGVVAQEGGLQYDADRDCGCGYQAAAGMTSPVDAVRANGGAGAAPSEVP